MGLDMYLSKAKRINGATAREIAAVSNYYDWLLRPSKYSNSSMYRWCGINKSEVNMSVADDYRKEYHTVYCAWDTEKKYGWLGIFDGIGYWRKANAIHEWFVKNVQGGKDDCGIYEVTKEQLAELLEVCVAVKNDFSESTATRLLPTMSGFFFGSTEYDEYYWEQISYTISLLEKIINETDFNNEMIVYSSSW